METHERAQPETPEHDAEQRTADLGYDGTITETASMLDEVQQVLLHAAERLMIGGVWKPWTDSAPVGISVSISQQALRSCKDSNVVALVGVMDAIADALAVLRPEASSAPSK